MTEPETLSPEAIEELRRRVVRGEDVSRDELRSAVRAMRDDRAHQALAATKVKKPSKRTSKVVPLDDLLG